MAFIPEQLSSLRQEITRLQNTNIRYSLKRDEKSALEVRTRRLLQIKQELSDMLNHRHDPVWWDKFRKPNRVA